MANSALTGITGVVTIPYQIHPTSISFTATTDYDVIVFTTATASGTATVECSLNYSDDV